MKARVILAVVGLVVALALTACGGTTPAACLKQANTSPGTVGGGPVSIATDHSIYAPGDLIQATITNHLPTTVAVDSMGGADVCPYFLLQRSTADDWQNMPACVPQGGDAAPPASGEQRITPGASFSSFVGIRAELPAGTYRLWIDSYRVYGAQGRVTSRGTTESATFQVCACRVCA